MIFCPTKVIKLMLTCLSDPFIMCFSLTPEFTAHFCSPSQGSTIRVALWPGASRMLCRASASGTDLTDRASGHHETPVGAITTLTKYSFHTKLNKNSVHPREILSNSLFSVMKKHCIRASKS